MQGELLRIQYRRGCPCARSRLDRVARAYGCSRREWFTSILLPHALPFLLTGTRLALGRALVVVIAEIFVGSLGGIGYFIINVAQQFQSASPRRA